MSDPAARVVRLGLARPGFTRALAAAVLSACLAAPSPGLAADPAAELMIEPPAAGHEHAPLTVDESLSLAAVLDRAVAGYPEALELEARAAEAEAWEDRGGDWLQDRPSLFLRYQTDRWGDDEGLDEYEAGILLPLWSWRGRSATRSYGRSLQLESDAAGRALRWEVAGVLRTLTWDIELASETLEFATRLAATTGRRQALGDAAVSDTLLAEAAALEAQAALTNARAALVDAIRAYGTLTGLDRRPPPRREALSPRTSIGPDHPALAYADAEVRRAEAARELAERTTAGGPDLLIGPRRERAANGDDFDDSVGLSLNVPFGPSSIRRTETAAAQRELDAARAARLRLLRRQTLARHEAAHGLESVRETLAAASRRAELAARHYEMAEHAHAQGELDLMDLLRLQQSAFAAKRALRRLEIEESRQIAAYNQAVGESP
jgi:hypothetical protein